MSSDDHPEDVAGWQWEEWRSDYRILWDQINRDHSRRNTWNTILLTANSILLGALSVGTGTAVPEGPPQTAGVAGSIIAIASIAGAFVCLIWLAINRRLDLDTEVKWAQINELEVALRKDRVSISCDARAAMGGTGNGPPVPRYLSGFPRAAADTASVKRALRLLSCVFVMAYAMMFLYGMWRLSDAGALCKFLGPAPSFLLCSSAVFAATTMLFSHLLRAPVLPGTRRDGAE